MFSVSGREFVVKIEETAASKVCQLTTTGNYKLIVGDMGIAIKLDHTSTKNPSECDAQRILWYWPYK